jgi:hypothetical protein
MTTEILADFANYGVVGNGSTDDTAHIQSAIDAALAAGVQTVRLPAGQFKITSPLYLDPLINLRTGPRQTSAFSVHLTGDQGGMNTESYGSSIHAYHTNAPAIIVGPGRGMRLSHVQIANKASPGSYPKLSGASCVGVGVANNMSKFTMEHCSVSGFHTAVKTGFNGDNLADSNSFYRCFLTENYIGIHIAETQNYINGVVECDINCKIGIISDVGKAVNVYGGNYSYNGQFRRYTISSTTLVESPYSWPDNPTWIPRLTAHVSSPTSLLTNMIVDVGALWTTHFGMVPIILESFNSSTGTLTFSVQPEWMYNTFGDNNNGVADSDLIAEMQTATFIDTAEVATTFKGTGFNVEGVHIENPTSVTTVIDHFTYVTGDAHNKFEKLFFNYNVSHGDCALVDGYTEALFWCQLHHPFVRIKGTATGEVVLRDWSTSQTDASLPVTIYTNGPTTNLIFDRVDLFSPNIYCSANTAPVSGYDGYATHASRAMGFGKFDTTPFMPRISGADHGAAWRSKIGLGQSEFFGYRPAGSAMPRIRPAQVDALLPSPTNTPDTIVPMCGDTIYNVSNFDSGAQRYVLARHAGKFWTWGSDFAVSWNYKGKSNVITVSDTSLFFAGLQIILNDGTDDRYYVVTGVFPYASYITITKINDYGSSYFTDGSKTTVYSGTLVKQERFRVVKYGRQAEFASALTDLRGKAFSQDDIVWRLGSTAGTSPGWVCTLAGVVGSGAGFSPMPALGTQVVPV